MTVRELVTHSGGFHADEVLSTAVLSRLFPDAALVRSRSPDRIAEAEGRIVYDVGRRYDAAARMFDHHQKPPPLRDDGAPLSSFGLIWRHFGHDYLAALDVTDADRMAVHTAVDASFVRPVDLLDNGAMEPSVAGPLATLTLPVLLEALKPVFDARSGEAEDAAFRKAVPVAATFLEAVVSGEAARLRADALVRAAIDRAGPSRVLELPMGMPHRAAIEAAGADHLLFVVHPRETDWALAAIRVAEDSFAVRAPLPASWAGLTDSALEAASGVPGATFCHNGRFIAVARSRVAILDMADRAVSDAES